jgi:Fe-S cluster assembly iron-binding protein IscA
MQINQQIGVVLALSASTGMAVRRALDLAGMSAESGGMRITARPTRSGYDYQFSVEPNSRETDLVVEQHGVRVYIDPSRRSTWTGARSILTRVGTTGRRSR